MSYHKPKYKINRSITTSNPTMQRAGRAGKGLLNHALPLLVIFVITGFLSICALILGAVSLMTHSFGGWTGSTYTRAEQACMELVRSELYSSDKLDPADNNANFWLQDKIELQAITKTMQTSDAMAIADGAPFHHNTKITNLYADAVPISVSNHHIQHSYTMQCVVDMNAANSTKTELDPGNNISVKIM